jgi:AraC-like DNA-binding protein
MLGHELLMHLNVTLAWANGHVWEPGVQTTSTVVDPAALWFVEQGQLEATLNGKRWVLRRGEALLMPAGVKRERILTDSGVTWWSVGLKAQLFGRVDILPLLRPPILWQPDAVTAPLLRDWMAHAAEQWPARGSGHLPQSHPRDEQAILIGDGLARAIFGLCWRALSRLGQEEERPLRVAGAPEWLIPALWAIQEDPTLTPTHLCERFAVSPAHLRRSFRRFLGVPPQAYLMERRLERACRLLQTTSLTIAAVGEAIGFESVYTFSRVFTERFHQPPSRWRTQVRTAHQEVG